MYKKLLFSGQLACVPRALFWAWLVFACPACSARDVVIGTRGPWSHGGASEDPEAPAAQPAGMDSPDTAAAGVESSEPAPMTQTASSGGMTARVSAGMRALEDAAVGGAAPMSSGCGKSAPGGVNQISTPIGPAGYLLDLPSAYDNHQPYALLFAFRSSESPPDSFHESLNIGAVAGREAIVAYPEAPGGPAGMWNPNRDLPIFDDLLAQLLDRYCVDPRRVYVLGYATGGFFASAIACARGDSVRASALFAVPAPPGPCPSNMAIFLGQGDMDPVYPARAGRSTRDFWTLHNHCDPLTSTPATPSPCVDYAGCSEGTPVRYCEYSGGHELPSFAASAIWAFFSEQH